jgi:hypothetical protein
MGIEKMGVVRDDVTPILDTSLPADNPICDKSAAQQQDLNNVKFDEKNPEKHIDVLDNDFRKKASIAVVKKTKISDNNALSNS